MKYLKKIIKTLLIILLVLLLILILDYVRINIKYIITKSNYETTFKVYGNKNGYVPQGLAYLENKDIVLQTSYNKEVSKLFIIDFKTGKLLKDLKLINKDGTNNNGHVGGVAISNSKIWISSDYDLNIYNLDEVMKEKDKIKPNEVIKLPIRGDFCYYYDDTLWIGEFYLKPFYDVEGGKPRLYGYKVKENIDYNKPDYTLYLPKAVQGMTILPDNKVVFSQSFTYLVNSNLSIYDNILDKNKMTFNKSNKITTVKVPPMAEGMFYKDGYLYILFESSADKYSLADPKIGKVIKYKITKLTK